MQKIIQIVEGRTISCLTEDGKVYHWFTYYTDGKEKAFDITKEERKTFEKRREWVQIEDCEGIKFYSEARKLEIPELELDEEDRTANDEIVENQPQVLE